MAKGLFVGGLCALFMAIMFSYNYGARSTKGRLVAKSKRLEQKTLQLDRRMMECEDSLNDWELPQTTEDIRAQEGFNDLLEEEIQAVEEQTHQLQMEYQDVKQTQAGGENKLPWSFGDDEDAEDVPNWNDDLANILMLRNDVLQLEAQINMLKEQNHRMELGETPNQVKSDRAILECRRRLHDLEEDERLKKPYQDPAQKTEVERLLSERDRLKREMRSSPALEKDAEIMKLREELVAESGNAAPGTDFWAKHKEVNDKLAKLAKDMKEDNAKPQEVLEALRRKQKLLKERSETALGDKDRMIQELKQGLEQVSG